MPGTHEQRKTPAISFAVGVVAGVLGLLLLNVLNWRISLPRSLQDAIYLFGFLFLTAPAMALLGTTAASVYAGLHSSRVKAGSDATDTAVDPHGLIEAAGSTPRWLTLAILGAILLLLGALLEGYRFADGGLVKP